MAICGESADVPENVVDDWKSRLGTLCASYANEDIFNMDESGFFYRALPGKTLALKGETCSGGKKSNERLSVVFCCSLTGEKLKPLVIGKSAKLRRFKNLDLTKLGVTWHHSKNAWMTGALFEEWVKSLDDRMKQQNQIILLLLDNAPCHPNISEKHTNVKL